MKKKTIAVLVVIAVVLAAVAVLFVLWWFPKKPVETPPPQPQEENVQPIDVSEHVEEKEKNIHVQNLDQAVIYNGKYYLPNAQVHPYFFMGVDRNGSPDDANFNFAGQADTMVLLVVDDETQSYRLLQLDRDTMTAVGFISYDGTHALDAEMQLCLAHSFGTGLEDSCENTLRAVSLLLYEAPLSAYFAVNMDCIPIINDAIGGVPVTPDVDINKELKAGKTVTLNGEQAEAYLRARMSVGDGLNASRMSRQRTYLKSAYVQLKKCVSEDLGVAVKLFNLAKPYTVTNFAGRDIYYLAKVLTQYENRDFLQLSGEYIVEDQQMHFYVNEEELKEIVLSLFYKEVENVTVE